MSPTAELLRADGIEGVTDLAAALAAARANGGLLWVTLDHPERADFSELAGLLDLHELAVTDAVQARDRPKLDIYGTQRFLSLVTLRHQGAESPLLLGRVMVWAGDGFVVTVRQEDGDTLARTRDRLLLGGNPPAPLDVVHALVDTVVEDLVATSGTVEAALLASADRLFGPERSDEAHPLYEVTRQLLAMAHAVQPLLGPLQHLSDGSLHGLGREEGRRFQDVLDHAVVLDREITDHSNLVEHLRGANDSRIGLQQNTDMRKIAAWAAVIAVPTAISGFYGMNVPYPGFGEPSGFLSALALQAVLAVALLLVFRRRSWL